MKFWLERVSGKSSFDGMDLTQCGGRFMPFVVVVVDIIIVVVIVVVVVFL